MNNKMKIEGRLKNYLMSGLLLGILAVVVNIYVYTVEVRAGLIMTGFVLLYIAVQLVFFLRGARSVFRDMVNFATQYGQVQSSLLKNLDLPHALLDESGKIIWTNNAFERLVSDEKEFNKSVTHYFPAITKDKLPGADVDFSENEFEIKHNGS